MFSLAISIVAIALAAKLIAVVMYYFNSSTEDAESDIAAANGVIRAPVDVHQQSKPDLTDEEEELLSFLSKESFSFDAMQSRWP